MTHTYIHQLPVINFLISAHLLLHKRVHSCGYSKYQGAPVNIRDIHRCIKDWVILKFTAFCPLFKSVFLSKGINYKLLDCSILMPSLLWLYGFTISHAQLPRDALSCTLHEHALTINAKMRKLYQHHINTKLRLYSLDGTVPSE